jgi:hypothetical protein
MKSAWGPDLCDMAAWNKGQVEDVDVDFDFEDLLADDVDCAAWDGLDAILDDSEDVNNLDEEIVVDM